jgi:hypothetical protein
MLFFMLIKDIIYQIFSCCVQLFASAAQIYISCEPHRIENCIRNINMDLDRIHQWSSNYLAINPGKSQALLVNPPILSSPIVLSLLLGSNHITFVDKVKNLDSILNQKLTSQCCLYSGADWPYNVEGFFLRGP